MKQAPREELAAAIRDIVNVAFMSATRLHRARSGNHFSCTRKINIGRAPVILLKTCPIARCNFPVARLGTWLRNIAELLGLSVKTVESHRENIKRKLHVRSSAELSVYAAEWVEQSLFSEEHTFRGVRQARKRKVPSPGLRPVEAFTAPVTPDSELGAEIATIGSHSSGAVPVRTES